MSEIKEIRAIGSFEPENWIEAKEFTYEPQEMRPQDVDIKIEACGVCGSDTHVAKAAWGPRYSPICVGHEIVGHVVAAGPEARFKVGDRVGVGAQCDCCNDCKRCKEGNQNTCKKHVRFSPTFIPHWAKMRRLRALNPQPEIGVLRE